MPRSSRMTPRTPGGGGELIRAYALLDRAAWIVGRTIRLNPGGGEYEARVHRIERQPGLAGWVRITHTRPELGRKTVNVLPPSVEVRVLS